MDEVAQIRRKIYGRLSRMGLKEDKDGIVLSFSRGRTTHLSQLERCELDELYLKLASKSFDLGSHWGRFDISKRQHRYILSLCQQLGWVVYHERLGRNVADLARLGRWLQHYSKAKKPLMDQSSRELQSTISQLESMLTKHFA